MIILRGVFISFDYLRTGHIGDVYDLQSLLRVKVEYILECLSIVLKYMTRTINANFMFFCTVHCEIIIRHKRTKCTVF